MAKAATATAGRPAGSLDAKTAQATHPLYNQFLPIWRLLAYVREGTGGFLDGTMLIAHPREWEDHTLENPVKPTKKLKARRAIACYENIAATIVEAKQSALFREQATRRLGDGTTKNTEERAPIEEWWDDVDGAGTHIDDFLGRGWDPAATFGLVWLYFDRPAGNVGATAADTDKPFVRMYTPLDLLDWLVDDRGALIAVKFKETAPRTEFAASATPPGRIRVVTTEKWTLYDQTTGDKIEEGEHKLGMLPVVPLFSQRRPLHRHVGQAVLGDPGLYIDVYNLTSEVRELLRNQTFSWINVPLGTGDGAMSIEDAKTMLGNAVGTSNVLFSGLAADMLTADSSNVTVYHAEIERRLRTIYRLAGIQWEADSKDAEAKGSLQLKREDMNTRLAGYADELEKTDYQLARLFYRAHFGADQGDKRLAEDQLTIRYPDSFDMTPFKDVLEQAQAALSLGMPSEFLKALRKQLVSKFLPDLTPADLKTITDAIDAAAADLTPDQRLQARLKAVASIGPGAPAKPGQPVPPAPGEKGAAAA